MFRFYRSRFRCESWIDADIAEILSGGIPGLENREARGSRLSLKLFVYGGGIFLVFYGVAWVLRGYLIFRSGYLPRFLGVLMTLGGLAFVARNFALVLAPAYRSGSLLLLMVPGALLLSVWLLVRGVDVAKWEEKAATGDVNV